MLTTKIDTKPRKLQAKNYLHLKQLTTFMFQSSLDYTFYYILNFEQQILPLLKQFEKGQNMK